MTLPLRVAIVNWSSRRVGGIEDYVALVIDALHRADTPLMFWHEVDLPADRAPIDLPAGVPQICASDAGMDAALGALREWRPDVIYVHGLLDVTAGLRLQQIAPAVLFLHTYSGTCITGRKTMTRPVTAPCERTFGWPCLAQYFPRGCGGRNPVTMWTEFRRQSSQLHIMRGYRRILTHTEHMRLEMAKHGLQAEVVPYPVAAQRMPSEPRAGTSWRLLCASRLEVPKGGRVLLEALSDMTDGATQRVSLTVAGDGGERAALEGRARQLRSEAVQIEFTGWIPQHRIHELLGQTDLLVVPSIWPEPFGAIGPIAAQHGVPAAAFDVGGVRAWLTDGVSGHLASGKPPTAQGLADAIRRCLSDPAHHAALCRGARESARRFTMARHLPALMASFEQAARA